MLTVHRSSTPLSFEALFDAPALRLTLDWFRAPLETPLEIHLAADADRVWFGAGCAAPPRCAPALCGEFVEGLWERDVVEIFFGEANSTRYQEFNVSPRGAWWTMAFSQYRTRMTTKPMPGIRCHSAVVGEAWRAAIAIPLRELTISWSCEAGSLNAAAIQGSPQRFATAADLGGGEPDFHRAERFPRALLAG